MLSADEFREAVRKYADFIPCDINNEGSPTNVINAPLHQTFPTDKDRLSNNSHSRRHLADLGRCFDINIGQQ
ncbi:MAG: hypothetical protein O3A00_22255 [Planctomycetota bacterium]|nr:hypothetical protein [Planctomycetota bacterium]